MSPLLGDETLLGETKTKAEFTLYSLGPFPALVRAGNTSVVGEVYEVSEKGLARLDMAEGHPHFYRRTTIRLEDDTEVEAYLIPDIEHYQSEEVPSGDWVDYLTS